MLWRPPRRSWCMHRILCTACNRNRTLSFERGHDGNIVEEVYRGRYARQRLLNFWPESSCGYHAIKRFVCIIQVERRDVEELLSLLGSNQFFTQKDWKDRFKENSQKMRSGSIFLLAEVFKNLVYLSRVKPLS